MMRWAKSARALLTIFLWFMAGLLGSATALAGKVSDIRNTLHNLSIAGPGAVKAVNETQVCVFCHTPHGANTSIPSPLWNHKASSATYIPYTSSSLDAQSIQGTLDQPGGSSKLCLSCHDGTIAVGSVNVLGRQSNQTILMNGTDPGGVMPAGAGLDTGFTRNLGTDLTNDHPISVTYDSTLAAADGELRPVDPTSQRWPITTGSVIGVRAPGYKPLLPLEATSTSGKGQVQCGSCHDPHLRETDPAKGNQKFLRVQRFQETTPSSIYDAANDIICLSCHDKNLTSGAWAYSAHANPLVANEAYTASAAAQREFPNALPVWKASCLNCHDTHTVKGARRLLREGTDSFGAPKSGGNPSIEDTCYQCHTTSLQSAITNGSNPVISINQTPDLRTDYTTPGNRRMPLTNSEQGVVAEAHDIGFNFADTYVDCTVISNTQCGKDFVESRAKLGYNNLANRHAECSDCHNPHRVVKFRSFEGNGGNLTGNPDPAGTHNHAAGHTNIASGVLRGSWGVEANYLSASFQDLPSGYTVKRGDPGASASTLVSVSYVTREYQVCLKCHSDYGYNDDNRYPIGSRPYLGLATGGTLAGANGLTQFTNQAKEFQAPIHHKGEVTTTDSGAAMAFSTNNHRSWHPVIDSTGRDAVTRGNMDPTLLMAPWNGVTDIGTQTMYCSDCHGSATLSNTVEPMGGEDGNPWGPHGSSNDFILKGQWNQNVGTSTPDALCFRCHDYDQYANPAPALVKQSGFCCGTTVGTAATTNLHVREAGRTQLLGGNYRCSKCHVAVPHGWKNKGLLVNLNDVGPEAGLLGGTAVASRPYSQEPYYLGAWLSVTQFARSGQWTMAGCGTMADMTACGSAP